jgi:serine/threonine protein kinase
MNMNRHAHGEQRDAASSEAIATIPQPGDVLDAKYRIEGVIGQGGMAVVLAATHLHLDERVAIKLMLPEWAEDEELVERFMREGRAAIKIRSEHVVRVLDVGMIERHPYLVMEFLSGHDLDRMLEQSGPLPISLAVDYLLQACEAIAEAHASGIIHRDLKPANLFLTQRADGSGCVKVLDFGISKVTARSSRIEARTARTTLPSMVMGSPHYMSPEQLQSSKSVDERSDIWALGAILHELIAGSPPFKGDTITALCATILKDPPPPLTKLRTDVSPAVEAIVFRCLEKEPSQRFANVAELAAALAQFGSASAEASAVRIGRVLDGHIETLGAPWTVAERTTPNASALLDSSPPRHRGEARVVGYAVGAIAMMAIGSVIGWMIVKHDREVRAAERADTTHVVFATAAPPAPVIPPPELAPPPAAATSATSTAAPPATNEPNPPAPIAAATPSAAASAPPKDETSAAAIANASAARPASNAHSAHRPAPPKRAPARAPRPVRADATPEFPQPATKYVPSVGANADSPVPVAIPAPSPEPSTPPASSAPPSGEELFDDRK